MDNWKKIYESRTVSPDEAVVKAMQPGSRIVFGHAATAPQRISQAMFDNRERLNDITVFHMIYFGEPWHTRPEMEGHVRTIAAFLDGNTRPAYKEGRVDYLPVHFCEVPDLFRKGYYKPDIAVIHVSLPDENGFCSYSLSADYGKIAAECASVVIAEVNPNMPYIGGGDCLIHVSDIDYLVPVNYPITEVPPTKPGELELKIGQYCASLIKDGDTLQLGIGAIPDAVLSFLKDRKDIGLHTEMFTDGVMHAVREGIITGKRKNFHPNKIVATLIFGSKELYQFLDKNPMIECYSVDYVNDPYIIGQNDNLIAINSCIEMDLSGQAASESIGIQQFSGTGGQFNFLQGAKRSKGGVSILAFRSTAKNDTQSKIVPFLASGAAITAPRNDVDYVITEYGIAQLRGKTLRERAEALCAIAHPKFRPELQAEIKRRFDKK